jgi:hypothetical protein
MLNSPTIEAPEDEPFVEGEDRPPGDTELWEDGTQEAPEPEGPA